MIIDRTVYMALFSALVNVVLSHIIPCAVSANNQGFIREIREEFARNKNTMMISSVVIGIVVWVSLNYEREFRSSLPNGLINFINLNNSL